MFKLKKICAEDLKYLINTYDMLTDVQILSKLLSNENILDSELGANGEELLLQHTDTQSLPLFFEKIREMTTKSAEIISNILPNPNEVYDER